VIEIHIFARKKTTIFGHLPLRSPLRPRVVEAPQQLAGRAAALLHHTQTGQILREPSSCLVGGYQVGGYIT